MVLSKIKSANTLEEIVNSSSRIRRLIYILNLKSKSTISLGLLCKFLNINLDQLSKLFISEGINYETKNIKQEIPLQNLKKLKEKIEKIEKSKVAKYIYDKSLKELIINSDSFLSILESKQEVISLLKIAATLNLGIQHICKLFEFENIIINISPNTKISCDLLRHLLLTESEISFSEDLTFRNVDENEISLEKKICILKNKIEKIDSKSETKNILTTQFTRNEFIREYAKIRANGKCELCDNPAPFIDCRGNPFLETHHVLFLSKGGKDSIDNVVALCPNCHKKVHNLSLIDDVNELLAKLEKHKLNETKK